MSRRDVQTVTREITVEVECDVEMEPGEPCVMWGDNAHPGCGPDGSVVEIRLGDVVLPLSVLGKSDEASIVESAIVQASDDERDAYEDHCDRMVDEARDARFDN